VLEGPRPGYTMQKVDLCVSSVVSSTCQEYRSQGAHVEGTLCTVNERVIFNTQRQLPEPLRKCQSSRGCLRGHASLIQCVAVHRGVASGHGAPIAHADCFKAPYAPLRHRQRQKADLSAFGLH
jgi:hypothetical protein